MPQMNEWGFYTVLDNIAGCLWDSLLNKFGFSFQFCKFLKFGLIEKHKSIVMENQGTTLLIASLWSCSCSQCEALAEKLLTCNDSLGMAVRSICSCLIKPLNPYNKICCENGDFVLML